MPPYALRCQPVLTGQQTCWAGPWASLVYDGRHAGSRVIPHVSPADKDSAGQLSDGERERFPALHALSGQTAGEPSK